MPFTIRDVQDAARNQFQGHVEPLEGLTTYSFRRVLPTLGHMPQFSDEEHLAIGDWLDKDQSKAAMPHHYSAAKCQQSVELKHRACEVAARIAAYESWEMVPYAVLQEHGLGAKMFGRFWKHLFLIASVQRCHPCQGAVWIGSWHCVLASLLTLLTTGCDPLAGQEKLHSWVHIPLLATCG